MCAVYKSVENRDVFEAVKIMNWEIFMKCMNGKVYKEPMIFYNYCFDVKYY